MAAIIVGLYFRSPLTLDAAVEAETGDAALLIAFARQLSADGAPVRLRIAQVPGEPAVREAIVSGKADLGILRATGDIPSLAQAVAIIRSNVLVLVARSGSKLDSPAKLTGQRLGLVGADANQIGTLLDQYQVTHSSVKLAPIEQAKISAGLIGEVDVLAIARPISDSAVRAAIYAIAAGKTPTFVPIDQAKAIAQRNPAYEVAEIPAGSFGGNPASPPDTIETIGFAHVLLARNSLRESVVAELSRRLFAMRRSLAGEVASASWIAAANSAKDAPIPAHPGAAAFYNDSERSFFDRYGDWIYITAMAVSLIASMGAATANYLSSGRRRRRDLARRMGRLITKARIANSEDALIHIEAEADTIISRSLVGVEAGTLPPDTLAAFSLPMDLLRRAIAERKSAISGTPET